MDRKIIVVATRERDNDLSTLESVVIPHTKTGKSRTQ